MSSATAFAPGSIGNVGPGFDVLGLAVEGLGDRVTVELVDRETDVTISGLDANMLPRDPRRNSAAIAATAVLQQHAPGKFAKLTIEKGLPVAGGLGGSAASAVGGAYAALLACGIDDPASDETIAAALAGEAAVAGMHLDNIVPCVFGGLGLVRSVHPIDVAALPVAAHWWVALVTPAVRVQTKAARALLPDTSPQREWVQQMANTAALVHAFASGDAGLLRRALDDRYAEPRRAKLIPHFHDVKKAAFLNDSFGSSISGSGPTVFAIAENEERARACAAAMQQAFAEVASIARVAPIARRGVHRV